MQMTHWNNISDKETLEQLMDLSLIHLEEGEKDVMLEKLKFMFGFVDTIKKINTDGVEPLYSLTENINVFREDVPGENLDHDKALGVAQGKFKNENFFTAIK